MGGIGWAFTNVVILQETTLNWKYVRVEKTFFGPRRKTTTNLWSFRIMSVNIEGIIWVKETILTELTKNHHIDALGIQGTDRATGKQEPKIEVGSWIIDKPHEKYDSALLVKHNIDILHVVESKANDMKILTIEIEKYSVALVYNHLERYLSLSLIHISEPTRPY